MERPSFPYPTGALRILLKAPLIAYRLGLGDSMNSIRLMLLTSRGRKSGLPRHTPIEYRRHGRKIYVISGWKTRPDWYQNLMVDPLATVQLGRKTYSALADPVSDPAESLRAVTLFRQNAPGRYDAVFERLIEEPVNGRRLPDVSGQFTIMRLNILPDEPTLPPVPADWMWVWPMMLLALMGLAVLFWLSGFRRTERGEPS
jgi:deazaflavin-dependent oxidoreductase (nitroreductase family)